MKSWRMIGFAVAAAVAVLSFSANAETQTVAGVVWTYQPCEGGVAISSGHTYRPAIPRIRSARLSYRRSWAGNLW